MEAIFKTADGVILYQDENRKFHSRNPKAVMEALFKDIKNRSNDPIAGIIACEIVEEIQANGGIHDLNSRMHFFGSSDPKEKHVQITIICDDKKVRHIIRLKFREWGYSGDPVEL